jgi:hypothetical protein
VWVVWVPLLHGCWLLPIGLGREPYPCYTDQEPCHSESHNLIYFTRMVKAGNGAQWPGLGQDRNAYHRLPRWLTIPKSKWPCMRFPLPNLTGSCAHDAKPIGGFGLVVPLFTRAYHSRDLSRSRPGIAFTKHHRLVITIGIMCC